MVKKGTRLRGTCPVCRKVAAVTVDNRMWYHMDRATLKECAGSGGLAINVRFQ